MDEAYTDDNDGTDDDTDDDNDGDAVADADLFFDLPHVLAIISAARRLRNAPFKC